MAAPSYIRGWEKVWHYALRVIGALVLFYLIFPILAIIPLSFNALPFFVFTDEMLALDPAGYSLRWYEDFFTDRNWRDAVLFHCNRAGENWVYRSALRRAIAILISLSARLVLLLAIIIHGDNLPIR